MVSRGWPFKNKRNIVPYGCCVAYVVTLSILAMAMNVSTFGIYNTVYTVQGAWETEYRNMSECLCVRVNGCDVFLLDTIYRSIHDT